MSFDVVSLFTHVPTSQAIQVTCDRLMNDSSLTDRTSLAVDDICSLLQLCLEATYLAFEGKVYRQIHGTGMGSPVSVVVANLVMEDVEQEALSTFHTPPRFWRRYVNDTCTALPSNLVDSYHDHLNSINPCIQFMIERESDGQLPFLDILLNREEDGSIRTSVYHKATHTDQYLCFHSHHPAANKRAVVRTLMCRAEALSGRRAPCQDSMLHYWPDCASIWHNPTFVLLLLLSIDFIDRYYRFLFLFTFIFIYLLIILIIAWEHT